MSNSYYNNDTPLVAGELARAADLNANNDAIEAGFDAVEAVNLRSLKVPAGEADDQVLTEDATERAGKIIGFDDDGAVALYASFTATVASCVAIKTEAQTAQGLAEDAQTAAETARDQAQAAASAAASAAGLPALTDNAGKSLVVSADELGVEWVSIYKRLPIFSAEAAASLPVSSLEDISYGCIFPHGLGNISGVLHTSHGLFVTARFDTTATANVATSPDGETWTLRAMPSSLTWNMGTDGTNLLAAAHNINATATSTDGGVTWIPAVALPGNSGNAVSPLFNNGIWLVGSGYSYSSAVYTSTYFRGSWSTQTAPIKPAGGAVWGGYFIIWSTASYYYSATGETGSWLGPVAWPETIKYSNAHIDGNLYVWRDTANAQLYKFDAIDSVVAVEGAMAAGSASAMPLPLLGGVAAFNTTFGNCVTYHAGRLARRFSSATWVSSYQAATNGTVIVLPSGTNVITLSAAATSPTAMFEGV